MPTVNRKVLDISHHNDITSWSAIRNAGILGIIHKATEGTSFIDGRYQSRAVAARQEGFLWGAYHFATGSSVERQVEHFLNVVGVNDTMLYALDWEDTANTMSLEQARRFLELVDQRIGKNRCVVYSGNRAKEALGRTVDPFFGAHRLWLAQYGTNPQVQVSWQTYWLWQYSDGVHGPQPRGCPGVSGEVDTNSWEGSDAELREQWAGMAAPAPTLPVVTVSINPSGSARVIVTGAANE